MILSRIPKSLTFAIAAVTLLPLLGCGRQEVREEEPVVRPVKTLIVGAVADTERSFPGRVEASEQVNLSFRVGGQLIEFPVREGQMIRKDQLVARLDPRDFQIRVDSATAEFERAEADLQRISALYEKDAVSKAQLDQAKATRDVAKAAMDDAETNLGYTYLRAPFAGRIGETLVENFEDVRPKEPILSLINIEHIDIVIDLPESHIATARTVQDRRISGRLVASFEVAPGREFDLQIKEVAAQADPRTQTYRVTLTMRQPDGINILPGMTATVTRFGDEADAAIAGIVIPAIAVFSDAAGVPQVWVIDRQTMTVSRRPVATGDLTGTDGVRILDGLSGGEMIAVTAVTQLRNGMQIRPLSELEGYDR
jgi:RND family efflux transporter MFP subunit